MRLRTGLFILIGLLALAGLGLWLTQAPPPTAIVSPPPPAPPPPDAAAPDASAPATDSATPSPGTPDATGSAESALPALPEVKVADHPIHTVPEDTSPVPSPGHSPGSLPTPGQSEEVRLGAHALAPPPVPRQFSGTATPTGAAELKVDATTVALFGIKPPGNRDRCGADADGDCTTVAKKALAERIGATGKVSCRIPNPRPGTVSYAICLDPTGFDLSGFLIAQGLALADTGQSYDYVGAESVARNLKRGLWKFRS